MAAVQAGRDGCLRARRATDIATVTALGSAALERGEATAAGLQDSSLCIRSAICVRGARVCHAPAARWRQRRGVKIACRQHKSAGRRAKTMTAALGMAMRKASHAGCRVSACCSRLRRNERKRVLTCRGRREAAASESNGEGLGARALSELERCGISAVSAPVVSVSSCAKNVRACARGCSLCRGVPALRAGERSAWTASATARRGARSTTAADRDHSNVRPVSAELARASCAVVIAICVRRLRLFCAKLRT